MTLYKTRRERIYGQNCISIFSSMCKHFFEMFAIMSSIKFVLHHNAFCELFSLQSQHFFLKVYFRNLKKVSHTKWIEQWDLKKLCGFVKCHIYMWRNGEDAGLVFQGLAVRAPPQEIFHSNSGIAVLQKAWNSALDYSKNIIIILLLIDWIYKIKKSSDLKKFWSNQY